MDRIREL
jgi:hypothetical protein